MSILLGLSLSVFIMFLLINISLIKISLKMGRTEITFDGGNISIIIAAKNEQEKIKKLIDSITKLDYPKEKFEIIIVDDNSTDNTFKQLKKLSAGSNNILITQLSSESSGKRDALSFGINKSEYPYILITDADCQPQSNWLRAYSNKFELGYDMLFGIAPFKKDNTLVSRISCFENFRNSLFSISMAIIGLPYTAAARNFGFTKKAFGQIGGYTYTKNTLSGDDDLLLREAVKNKLKIGVVTDADSFVYSESKKTFSEYFQQRARHTQTSFYYLKRHQFILGFWHLINLSILFSPVLIFVNPWIGIFLPTKLFLDFVVTQLLQKKFGYKFSVSEIFCLQIIYELFLIVHFFNARFSKIKWK